MQLTELVTINNITVDVPSYCEYIIVIAFGNFLNHILKFIQVHKIELHFFSFLTV